MKPNDLASATSGDYTVAIRRRPGRGPQGDWCEVHILQEGQSFSAVPFGQLVNFFETTLDYIPKETREDLKTKLADALVKAFIRLTKPGA
jgi:hypothetical protein